MTRYIRGSHIGLVSLALVAVIGTEPKAAAQTVTPGETVRSVRKMLERLPYYGVFDFSVFTVDRGTVTLAGYTFQGSLKADAEMAGERRRRSGQQDRGPARVAERRLHPLGDVLPDLRRRFSVALRPWRRT